MAESGEELKSLLTRVKEENEKAGLKLNIKVKIMASSPITSWQIDGEKVEAVTDFLFLGSKITADGGRSHEIKRFLFLGRKAITNLNQFSSVTQSCPTPCDPMNHTTPGLPIHHQLKPNKPKSCFKKQDITLLTKVLLVKAMIFPVVMYGCESWTVKMTEHQRIDSFEL